MQIKKLETGREGTSNQLFGHKMQQMQPEESKKLFCTHCCNKSKYIELVATDYYAQYLNPTQSDPQNKIIKHVNLETETLVTKISHATYPSLRCLKIQQSYKKKYSLHHGEKHKAAKRKARHSKVSWFRSPFPNWIYKVFKFWVYKVQMSSQPSNSGQTLATTSM